MGRKRKSVIYSFFNYDQENNKSKCLIEDCGTIMKGHHGSNLLRHFCTQHRAKYDEIKEKENQDNLQNSSNNLSPILTKVIQNCVNLVTVHGRPFSLLQDKAFVELIELIPHMTEKNLQAVTPKNIRSRIEDKAYEIRRHIFDEIKNKLISLKVDVASVKSRRFLGVNLQYINDSTIVLRNLSVLELHERNTANFLKDTVMMVLSRFGIEIKQLYSIISDNRANMLAMSRKLTELQTELDKTTEDVDSFDEDNIISEINQTNTHQQFVDSLGEIEFQENDHNETLSRMTTVRCAAHTLQLAVKDACSDMQPLLEQCRQVVRALRTPNVALELRQSNLPQAVLDCPTRWDSIVNMLERLVQLKEFCITNITRFSIDDNTWTQIQHNLQALKPCSVLSKILQREQLTLGDFFISWMKCKLDLENLNTAMSMFLVICMANREKSLFENDVFLSAIYMDPRVNSMLSEEQLEKARQHLIATYLRYITLTTTTEQTAPQDQSVERKDVNSIRNSPSTSTTSVENRQILSANDFQHQSSGVEEQPSTSAATVGIDIFLQRQYRERRRDCQTNVTLRVQLYNLLKKFLDEPLLQSNVNILEFWEKRKITDPQLYFLSKITLAIPPTQVSVERLFSSLKFVLNNLRMSMKDSIIEDVLLVRNNALYHK